MAVTAALVKELREISGAGMSACKDALVEANGDIKRASEILREKGLATAAKKAGRVAAEGLVATVLTDDRKKGAIVEVNSETDFVAKNDEFVSFVQNMVKQALNSSAGTVEDLLAEAWVANPSETAFEALTHKIATIGENLGLRRFERFEAGANSVIIEYIHGGGRVGVMLELSAPTVNEAVLEVGRNVCMQIAAMSPQFVSSADMSAEFIAKEKEILTKTALKENESEAKPKPESVIEKMVEGRLKKQLKEVCLVESEYVRDDSMTVGEYLNTVGATVLRFVRYEKGEGVEKKEENFAEEVAKAMQG
ncbi:MAG: translation elongation factor Ts [Defluviitaleaceae bacterium]|nr:translation elongation factor Ts [Defluviitaleaceae bacterium]